MTVRNTDYASSKILGCLCSCRSPGSNCSAAARRTHKVLCLFGKLRLHLPTKQPRSTTALNHGRLCLLAWVNHTGSRAGRVTGATRLFLGMLNCSRYQRLSCLCARQALGGGARACVRYASRVNPWHHHNAVDGTCYSATDSGSVPMIHHESQCESAAVLQYFILQHVAMDYAPPQLGSAQLIFMSMFSHMCALNIDSTTCKASKQRHMCALCCGCSHADRTALLPCSTL
jgi:hypothetical protein